MNGHTHGCSKPSTAYPRMLKIDIVIAKLRSAMTTLGLCRGASAGFDAPAASGALGVSGARTVVSDMSLLLLGLGAELQRVPAGRELQVLGVQVAAAVAPLQVDLDGRALVLAEAD